MPLRWTAAGLVPYGYGSSDSDDEEDSGSFCDVCANLDRNIVAKWSRSGDHYFSIRDIKPSAIKAQRGICEPCTIICGAINYFRPLSTLEDDEMCIHIMAYDDSSRPVLVWLARAAGRARADVRLANAPSDAQSPAELLMEVYTDKDDGPSPWPAIGNGHYVSKDPTSDEAFELISKWIDKCSSDHPLCGPTSNPTLPSRVIDVGDDNCAPKLHISNGESEPYATLSHSWGKSQPLATTTETITSHTNGIAWDHLSKTFREAIIITRKLGLKYLWIDSLCIIQNDTHDWEVESPKMASIYKNSYVTIASTGYADGGGGLLDSRQSCQLNLEGKYIYAREYLDHEQFAAEDFGKPGQKWMASLQYPLFTRGWCFQERVLATRVLHYTPAGVFFECGSAAWCECQCEPEVRDIRSFKWRFSTRPEDTAEAEAGDNSRANDPDDAGDANEAERDVGEDGGESDNEDESNWEDLDDSEDEGDDEDEGEGDDEDEDDGEDDNDDDPSALWIKIVENYTGKSLSYQTDVLPALSGVASQWQQAGLGKYLAGLWEQNLATGLLWTSVEPLPEEFQSDGYLAPTFSWASRVGSIKSFDARKPHKTHVEILEAQCTPKGSNPWGQVVNGFVRLRGPLVKAKFHPEDCDSCATMFWQELNGGCHLWKRGYEAEYFNIDRATDSEIKKGKDVYLLLVATVEFKPESSTSRPPQKGDIGKMRQKGEVSHSAVLILQHTGNRNRYKRIGAAHDINDNWFNEADEKEIIIL